MGRYANTITLSRPADDVGERIEAYLRREGFRQVDVEKNVWQKGMGLMLGPQFIRYEAAGKELRLEAWIKFALLPGIYVGEMGIDGLFAVIPKKKLKGRVQEIERIAE